MHEQTAAHKNKTKYATVLGLHEIAYSQIALSTVQSVIANRNVCVSIFWQHFCYVQRTGST